MTVLELLQQYEIPHKLSGEHHHVTSKFVGVDCFDCSPESGKYKLGISLAGGFASCWTCGNKGMAYVLSRLTRLHKDKIREIIEVPKLSRIEEKSGKLKLPYGLKELSTCHKRYLKKRRFNPDELEHLYKLRGLNLAVDLSWRIFIPVLHRTKTVSWTTRTIVDGVEPRYIAARPEQEAIKAKSLLYGEDFARHRIIIVEGHFDMMRIGPGCVATGGLGYTRSQLQRMAGYLERTIIFDNEVNAQQRAKRLMADLSSFPGKTNTVQIDAPDPAEMKPVDVQLVRESFL